MLVLALVVAGCAAYFSVWGLSQLFAGASTAVIIMASALEIGKIVTTTALHTYWNQLAGTLKVYLTISVGILMIITSAGIYGFLSNAYQSTANKLEIHEGQLGVLEAKKQTFEKTIADNNKIIETKTKRVDQLNNLRGNQEARLDNSTNNRNQRNARKDIESSDKQIQGLNTEIDALNAKNIVLSDSVNAYNVKMIELKSGSEISGEIGPLKYISELTGVPMANVVNYMILLLIFVFDPLAVALVLATNRIFELEGKQTPLEPKKPDYDGELMDPIPHPATPITITEMIKENSKKEEVFDEDHALSEVMNQMVEDLGDEFIEEPIMPDEQHDDLYEIIDEESEGVNEEIGEIDLTKEPLPIPEKVWIPNEETIMPDEQHDYAVNDQITDSVTQIEPSTTVSEKSVEVPVYKREPVVPTGKVTLEDIKEIKEGRGFSVDIPNPKTSNTIERIGSNKIIKNGDNNKVFFKRG